MKRSTIYFRTGVIAREWRHKSSRGNLWQLRWKPVCASTELSLAKWLKEKPLGCDCLPRAFVSARQNYGRGQRGKEWQSPYGGVWISAALSLSKMDKSTGLFGLAVAVALTERLRNKNIPVHIKWPNDLVVGQKKLSGILPRLIYRGDFIKIGQVGVGLNVRNRVPSEGISIAQILKRHNCDPWEWTAEVLLALENARDLLKEVEVVRSKAESFLWSDRFVDPINGKIWQIEGLNATGALKIRRGFSEKLITRWS